MFQTAIRIKWEVLEIDAHGRERYIDQFKTNEAAVALSTVLQMFNPTKRFKVVVSDLEPVSS